MPSTSIVKAGNKAVWLIISEVSLEEFRDNSINGLRALIADSVNNISRKDYLEAKTVYLYAGDWNKNG